MNCCCLGLRCVAVLLATAGVATAIPMIGATAVAQAPASAPAAAASMTCAVDPVHSMALFRVHHLGAGQFWGLFNSVKGTATYDAGKSLSLDVTIDAASIHSGNDKLDQHLMSPDFFDVKEFPSMTFKTLSSTHKGGSMWELSGDMTIRGKTQRVTVPVECTGVSTTRMGARAGFEATFTIKRSDYGVSYGVENGSVGDETRIVVSIEGVKAQPADK